MRKTLLKNARLATFSGDSGYGLIDDGVLLVDDSIIEWIGPESAIPSDVDAEIIDCAGRLVTPGLIDCHTHIVYGGDRADEFEQRLEGASYQEIARRGGGIISTVRATREATDMELLVQSTPRLQRLLDEGVTTLEIKSGYGLNSDNEIKMLRVAKRLGELHKLRVKKTFLGAHALPPEYADKADDYIDEVCKHMLPNADAAGLVDAVDVFIESIGFSIGQARKVFETAESLGLPVKAHAEQLSDLGGAVLAAEHAALSVDHIEYLKADDVPVLAKSGTVAVLLPGAFYVLRETRLPPVDALRKYKVPMAIATDANPGSSPVSSLLLMLNMACTLFKLTPSEAWRGVTINAAKALGLDAEIGSLEAGKQADLVIWDVDRPATIAYQIGLNPCVGIMQAGFWRKPLSLKRSS